MLNQPCLNPAYIVETIEPDTVFFISERESICFQNPIYYNLVQLINSDRIKQGTAHSYHNIDEIIEILQLQILQNHEFSQESPDFFQKVLNFSIKIQKALFQLHQKKYILDRSELLPSNLAILCHHLNVSSLQAHHQLKSIKVNIKTLGSLNSEDFINILKSFQIQVVEEGDLTIILTDDYLHPDLDEFNQQALSSQKPWMLVKPVGTISWIAPLFIPHKTGCWHCFAQRWRDNSPMEEFIKRKNNKIRYKEKEIETTKNLIPPLASCEATMQTALTMAATEVFKWIVQKSNSRIEGNLITYDTLSLQTSNHTLVKRPQCPSCGQIFNKTPLPVVLGHQKKAFTIDGGHRICSPEETLNKYQYHISPITGIVRELIKIPTQGLINTYVAKHHFRNAFDNLDGLRKNIDGKSGGKGKTNNQAKASGFCEAIERYSGVFQGYEIRQKASYQDLGNKAIHPNQCMGFSEKQYQTRETWNKNCGGWFQKVPHPFDETREIDWTPVWSLTAQDFKYLPSVYCYYGYPQSEPLDCWGDSNGCAAGNTIEEAILQGFMELVERDCIALWWYNQLSKPQVDLDSFDDPYFQQLKQYYKSLNREIWVLDITSDFNIPCFAAISSRKDSEVEDIVLGYGAHFDPKIAISRALTEVNQILPNVLSFDENGNTNYPPSGDPLALKWWKNATLSNNPYLATDHTKIPKKSSDYLSLASDDLLEDLKLCQKIVEENDMEMLVLDQTRPDIGLRVAKVIVPGMCHMWKRLGAKRLYDIPIKMGWLKQPLKEAQLNPFPMWM